MVVGVAGLLQRATQVGNPRRRPAAGDLGAPGVIVRVNEYDTHWWTPAVSISVDILLWRAN
ncbi:hypothetical protein D516_3142 [Rhodobacter sp. AKP1]|nr:hypothetical protein D516_3142 [Rhodobacter sp. AKP1]